MGIKNLPRRLNEAGKIKIGKKGEETTSTQGKVFRTPVRFDHFMITTTEKDEAGDFVVDTALMNKIKESGRGVTNQNGDLVGIPIRLLYDDTDLNFPTRYASYVSGKLSCYGDGETAFARIDDFKKEKQCPCNRLNADYEGKDKCKANGSLTCVIDEAGLFGQAHKFRTTGINSVTGILGGIDLIKTATKGRIAGLPLMLVVNNKSTTIPGSGQPTTVQVVSLCYRGDMMALRHESLKLLKDEQQYLLGMDEIEKEAKANGAGNVIEDDEEKDFIDEFMPDARASDAVIDVEFTNTNTSDSTETEIDSSASTNTDTKYTEVDIEVVDRLKVETDPSKAIALIKRLRKESALTYLHETFPHKIAELPEKPNKSDIIDLLIGIISRSGAKPAGDGSPRVESHKAEPVAPKNGTGKEQVKPKHPFLIELSKTESHIDVANAMTKYFRPLPINRTLPVPELLKLAERLIAEEERRGGGAVNTAESETSMESGKEEETQTTAPDKEESPTTEKEAQKEKRAWDNGGPIERPQLIELVKMKNALQLSDESWFRMVGFFLDQDGNRVEKATLLTQKQGDTFIEMLSEATITDYPPF